MNNKHYVGRRVSSFQRYDDIGPVAGIALVVDDENEYLAGDQNGYVLEVPCSYGTQAMADQLLIAAKGKVYKGYSATKSPVPALAELGDGITVNGLYGLLASREVDFGGGHYSDIAAPGENTVEHRYPVGMNQSAKQKRYTDRKIADTKSSITKTTEQIRLEVSQTYATKTSLGETETRLSSSITQTATSIKNEVSATYATKDALSSAQETLSSSITQTADNIKSEVKDTYATKTALSSVEQTANKITWLVKSGTSSTNFELTDRAIKLVSDTINLTGYVTFNALKGSGTSEINGGNILSESITADKLTVEDLSALKATIAGFTITKTSQNNSIRAGALTSINDTNSEHDGIVLSTDGIRLGNSKGVFKVTTDGTVTATNANVSGKITTNDITATGGKIGGFTIDNSSIRSGETDAITAGSIALSITNFTREINGVSRSNLRFAIGQRFGVSAGGILYASDVDITGKVTATSGSFTGSVTTESITATGGTIAGFTLINTSANHAIYSGMNTLNSTATPGVYLGTTGIALGGGKFKVTDAGKLTATEADITGKVITKEGEIGGFTIDDASIRTGASTASESGNVTLAAKTFSRTIDGTERDALRFAIGQNFAVNNNGVLYASNVHIKGDGEFSGKVTATSGEFSGKVTTDDITATGGTIAGFTLINTSANHAIYSGMNTLNSTATPGIYLGTSGIALGGGKFKVTNAGKLTASDGTFDSVTIKGSTFSGTNTNSGTISGGTISQPTISGSTLSGTTTNTGATISGGTFSKGTISGGTLSSSTGGTYVGTCSGSTLSSCNLGGTSLAVASGSTAAFRAYSTGCEIAGQFVRIATNNTNFSSSSTAFNNPVNVYGSLYVSGDKDRMIKTENYGTRLLAAFETPLPTFSDYGTASLDETGVFYIIIDPIFAETVDNAYLPTVFLTKYGEGDIWVERVTHDIVTVRGTPGLEFAWETRYAQANAWVERLRVMDFDYKDMSTAHDFQGDAAIAYEHSKSNIDYAQMGYEYYTDFERSLSA